MTESDLTKDGATFAMLAVRELQGVKCYCGATKRSGQTFCRREYFALPPAKRQALYSRVGEGYEEAYKDARGWLTKREK